MSEILEVLLLIVVAYVGYLLIWFVLNLVAYFLSLAFKSPKILQVFVSIAGIIYYVFSFILGIYLLWFTISLLLSGEILWFILMLLFGGSIVFGIIGFLQMPFIFIPSYFLTKIEDTNLKEDVEKGEILDEKEKVVGITESETSSKRRVAIWFLTAYFINLFSLLLNKKDYPGYLWGDFITTPFLWVLSQILFFGILLSLYYKIRKGRFFYNGKKYFLGNTLRLGSIVFFILTIIYFAFGVWSF